MTSYGKDILTDVPQENTGVLNVVRLGVRNFSTIFTLTRNSTQTVRCLAVSASVLWKKRMIKKPYSVMYSKYSRADA